MQEIAKIGVLGSPEQLDHVGLVVWQSAFVLAEYLLRNPPFGQWSDVRVVDLGTGTGELSIQASQHASQTVHCIAKLCTAKHQQSITT